MLRVSKRLRSLLGSYPLDWTSLQDAADIVSILRVLQARQFHAPQVVVARVIAMSHGRKCSEVLAKGLREDQCRPRILRDLTRTSWAGQDRDCRRYQRRSNANLFLGGAQDLRGAAEPSE